MVVSRLWWQGCKEGLTSVAATPRSPIWSVGGKGGREARVQQCVVGAGAAEVRGQLGVRAQER